MRGAVIAINTKRGRFALAIDGGDFCAFELLEISADIELADVLSGNLDSGGSETLKNERTGELLSVCMEITGGSRQTALAWTTGR